MATSVDSVASEEYVESPTILYVGTIFAEGISTEENISEPTVWCGEANVVAPQSISSRASINDIAIVIDQSVEPIGISDNETFGTISVIRSVPIEAEITPESVDSAEVVSVVAIQINQTIEIDGIASGEILGEPEIFGHSEIITVGVSEVLARIGISQQFDLPESVYEVNAAVGDIEVGGFCYFEIISLVPGGDFFVEGE